MDSFAAAQQSEKLAYFAIEIACIFLVCSPLTAFPVSASGLNERLADNDAHCASLPAVGGAGSPAFWVAQAF